jgi:type VI protein secretion system component VasK
MTDQQDNWHLSKSVPVTFLFGLVVQAVAIVWVFTMTIANVEENREDLSRLEIRVSAIEDNLYSLAVATARMDENIKAIRKAVEQMADHP